MIHNKRFRPESRGIGMTSQGTRDRLVQRLREKGISNEKVLQAIANTPRHLFVDEALSSRAYEDTALPIGQGQTISQPFVVALMTQELVKDKKLEKVLEVGTGSGYQAAVLALLVEKVFTVERIDELLRIARRRFREAGVHNIYTRHADGHLGWPSQAPFDGILITAATQSVPPELLDQLDEGASLVAPVERDRGQRLVKFTRHGDEYEEQDLGGVIFVPMLSGLI